MNDEEKEKRLRSIHQALKVFPAIVKQDEARGKAHRKLLKAFEPMAKDLRRRMKARKLSIESKKIAKKRFPLMASV